MSSKTIDIQALRAKFPALAQSQVFLDNAGGSQILGAVADASVDNSLHSSS
jgi:selenocysteine lyase/cysteine desulfurase